VQPDPFALAHLIAAGDIDVVPGEPPVPIAIWRVAAIDAPYGLDLADGMTPRMAALLVGYYTWPGDSIVSVGHDPALAGAAGAGGRNYLAVDDPTDLVDVDRIIGTVRLVVLSWPPARRPRQVSPAEATDLFTACRVITGRDGCTIVAFAPMEPDDTYAEHSGLLVPAARHAGLGLLQHIVAITAPVAGERLTWRATPADRATLRAATHVKIHMDLLVFMPRQTSAGSPKLTDSQREPKDVSQARHG
jgi:hypothetical protein